MQTKFFCGVLLFVVGLSLRGQTPVWTQFPNSPVGSGNFRNDDIYFTDLTNGWSARGRDGIYRTTNAGLSWVSVTPTNVANVAHFRSIGFASPTHGWAGNLGPGSYDSLVTDTNLLYETFDGGNTWSVNQTINNSGMQGFCAMHIKDAQHIYGVGRVRGPAYFVKSEDGGSSWYVTNLTAGGVMGGLMDVYFMNTNLGFTVGMNTNSFYAPPYYGSIARTTNGGLSWQVLMTTTISNCYFWKMSWPSTNVGYVSLQQNASYSSFVFYKTTDGGNTWVSNGIPLSAIGSPSSFELQGIGFVSTNEGWLGGGSLAAPYNMIHTTDGGLTWTPMGYVNANNLNRFRFASPTLGYLSGIKLHVYHIPPAGVISPASVTTSLGSSVTFSATSYGTPPITLQWRFNGTNIPGATTNFLTLANIQATNAGNYDIIVSDFSGSVTSSVAVLGLGFVDDFDSYVSPSVVTSATITNGYKIFFGTASGPQDFKLIFGFDYSTVTFPTNIPPAPHSSGGTTKGLFMSVNKDATGVAAAVNLYPTNESAAGNFALKFDVWLNWTNIGSSSEHALFGINHSGNITNRIGQTTSDGLFFAMDGDGNVAATTTTIRDYAVFHGGGVGAIPILMTGNNTTFGPMPPLGANFDNNDAGFVALFPPKSIAGYPTTPPGTAGLGWVSGEVRQENNVMTWLLNGVAVAQYTNTFGYTSGTVMIGYNDVFDSLGSTNNFVIFDNVRVEPIVFASVNIISPQLVGTNFSFSFATEAYESYTVQWSTNLAAGNWTTFTNFYANGLTNTVSVPPPPNNYPAQFFRVTRP